MLFVPEVVAVVGSVDQVEGLLTRINSLTKYFADIDFDVYNISNIRRWKTVMDNFWNDVENIEIDVKIFVDEAFQNLRSAEGAFDMLVRFKNIKSRDSINAQLNSKFGDILAQYEKQVRYLLLFLQYGPLRKNFVLQSWTAV